MRKTPLKIKGSRDQTVRVQVLNELSLFIDPGFFFVLYRKQEIKPMPMGAEIGRWVLWTGWPQGGGRGSFD